MATVRETPIVEVDPGTDRVAIRFMEWDRAVVLMRDVARSLGEILVRETESDEEGGEEPRGLLDTPEEELEEARVRIERAWGLPGRYRKLPVVVRAWRRDELVGIVRETGELPVAIREHRSKIKLVQVGSSDPMVSVLGDAGSWLAVPKGYWIIEGTKGELYPCDPETFEDIYEPVGEETTVRLEHSKEAFSPIRPPVKGESGLGGLNRAMDRVEKMRNELDEVDEFVRQEERRRTSASLQDVVNGLARRLGRLEDQVSRIQDYIDARNPKP